MTYGSGPRRTYNCSGLRTVLVQIVCVGLVPAREPYQDQGNDPEGVGLEVSEAGGLLGTLRVAVQSGPVHRYQVEAVRGGEGAELLRSGASSF